MNIYLYIYISINCVDNIDQFWLFAVLEYGKINWTVYGFMQLN
jgi:hypothetical protein